jgi:hypothetical protein
MNRKENFIIIIIVLLCIGYLNSSLLVSYYYSDKIFQENDESSQNINVYFAREDCAYSLILMHKESLLLNTSINTNIYKTENDYDIVNAIDYTIINCLAIEN